MGLQHELKALVITHIELFGSGPDFAGGKSLEHRPPLSLSPLFFLSLSGGRGQDTRGTAEEGKETEMDGSSDVAASEPKWTECAVATPTARASWRAEITPHLSF